MHHIVNNYSALTSQLSCKTGYFYPCENTQITSHSNRQQQGKRRWRCCRSLQGVSLTMSVD